jgi:hypothetical protein
LARALYLPTDKAISFRLNAKKPAPISYMNMPSALSDELVQLISPKPILAIVAQEKYKLFIYCIDKD